MFAMRNPFIKTIKVGSFFRPSVRVVDDGVAHMMRMYVHHQLLRLRTHACSNCRIVGKMKLLRECRKIVIVGKLCFVSFMFYIWFFFRYAVYGIWRIYDLVIFIKQTRNAQGTEYIVQIFYFNFGENLIKKHKRYPSKNNNYLMCPSLKLGQ